MPTKKDALTAPEAGSLAVPDWMKAETDSSGTDHLTRDDVTMPRLGLAQQMSFELDPSHSRYIEDLKVGDLFNTVTQEVYGKGPRDYAILRADRPRYIEFWPREQGGGVKDMNVPENDPRTQFGPNGEVPAATKFYDYIMVGLPLPGSFDDIMSQVVALSLKSTGLKVAKQINSLLMFRRPRPIYASIFRFTTGMDQNKHGKFAVYQVASAGYVQEQATFAMLKELAGSLKDREIKIDRDHEDVDDSLAGGEGSGSTDFPTGERAPGM